MKMGENKCAECNRIENTKELVKQGGYCKTCNPDIRLNGHNYSKDEIFEALRSKGYLLLPYTYTYSENAYMGGFEVLEEKTYCALKAADFPSPENLWQNVAIRVFQKGFTKPKLI